MVSGVPGEISCLAGKNNPWMHFQIQLRTQIIQFFWAREGICGIIRKVPIYLRECILGKGRGDTGKKASE